MSAWTHIHGAIMFRTDTRTIYPHRPFWRLRSWYEMHKLQRAFSRNIPTGSEGPAEIRTTMFENGPALVICGALRDYCGINEPLSWLNDAWKNLNEPALLPDMVDVTIETCGYDHPEGHEFAIHFDYDKMMFDVTGIEGDAEHGEHE